MAYKPNEVGRLTLAQLNEYKEFSGLTERQFYIIKRKFYDADFPKIIDIRKELNISNTTYNIELHRALAVIAHYEEQKRAND